MLADRADDADNKGNQTTVSTRFCDLEQCEVKLIMKNQNTVTYEIRGAIYSVYNELGPGLLESIYEGALLYELQNRGLNVKCQVPVKASYKGVEMDFGYRIDLLVEDDVIVEVKSVESLHDVHKKQLLTYLKLAHKSLGILINFNVAQIEDKINLIRVIDSSAQSA